MSADADEVRALARAFARKLESLHEFRGVAYVGAAPTPKRPLEDRGAELGSEAEAEAEPAGERAPPATREPAPPLPVQAPVARAVSGAGGTPRPLADPSSNFPAPQSPYSPAPGSAPARPNRDSASGSEASSPTPATPAVEQWTAARKLAYLRERNVGDCSRCRLSASRRNIVFGVGNPEADLMFIGEAPGADEDRLGEPFVGAAGRRLDQWITQLGMRREDVYIANVLKCRPPNNRDPQPDEITRCSPFLHAQVRAIEPKVIVALGRFAGCLLLGTEAKLWEMRGKVHRYREPKSGAEIPLLVTYHPAYVLRSEQRPAGPSGQGRPDRGGAIKTEDEKVLADIERAVSLVRAGV